MRKGQLLTALFLFLRKTKFKVNTWYLTIRIYEFAC